jgi:hypothetical protein
VSVVRRYDAGRADVYNLTVEDEPEFFANGVLVHNCDAGRYLLINLGTGPEFILLDDVPDTTFADHLGDFRPAGAFAVRPHEVDNLWPGDEDRPGRGVQPSPFV